MREQQLEEQTLEAVSVTPGASVWTLEAQSVWTGTLYGVAVDPRLGRAIQEALADPAEMPPTLYGVEEWQILWRLEPEGDIEER